MYFVPVWWSTAEGYVGVLTVPALSPLIAITNQPMLFL